MDLNELPECLFDYEIESELGNEGPAVVYRARQRSLDRTVALYLIRADEFINEIESERFLRGARAAAQLDHPAIVRVYDVGGGDGWSYVATGLVDGVSLDSKLAGRPVELRQAVELVRRLAVAVAAAHKRKVVHGSLEPSSIRIDANRQPRITGFGTATLWSPDATLTRAGGRTSLYSAPELVSESSPSHSPSLDVYGLGGILFFALTGKPLYPQASTAELVSIIAEQVPPLPSKLNPKVPPELDQICAACLKKSPTDRIPSASALADQLQQWLKGPKEVAIPASLQETILTSGDGTVKSGIESSRPDESSPSRSKVTMAVGVAIVLVLSCGLGWYWRSSKPNPSTVGSGTTSTETNRSQSMPPLAVAPFSAAEALAHQKAWASYLGQEVSIKNSIGMTLQLIPAGEFMMGATEEEINQRITNLDAQKEMEPGARTFATQMFTSEGPQHSVRLTQPFYLAKFEVTTGQFQQFVKETGYQTSAERAPEGQDGIYAGGKCYQWIQNLTWRQTLAEDKGEYPVGMVSWWDAEAFCRWLSEKENACYRLPTEAEWEFACRSGTTGLAYCGNGEDNLRGQANVIDQSTHKIALPDFRMAYCKWEDGFLFSSPVGRFPANRFGIHDMIGNVWEMCGDWTSENYGDRSSQIDPQGIKKGATKVFRGGGYDPWTIPDFLNSTSRMAFGNVFLPQVGPLPQSGFRVVREVPFPTSQTTAQNQSSHLFDQAKSLLDQAVELKGNDALTVSRLADHLDTAESYANRADKLLLAAGMASPKESIQNRIISMRTASDSLFKRFPRSKEAIDFPRHRTQLIDWNLLSSYSFESHQLAYSEAAVAMERLFSDIEMNVLKDDSRLLRRQLEKYPPHARLEVKYWLTRWELWAIASKRPEASRLQSLAGILSDDAWDQQFLAARTSSSPADLLKVAAAMKTTQLLSQRVLVVEALAIRNVLDRPESTNAINVALESVGDPSYFLWPHLRQVELKLGQLAKTPSNSDKIADTALISLDAFVKYRPDLTTFTDRVNKTLDVSSFRISRLLAEQVLKLGGFVQIQNPKTDRAWARTPIRTPRLLPAERFYVTGISFDDCTVSDSDILGLTITPELKRLHLARTRVTDQGIEQLSKAIKGIAVLSLEGTNITDAALLAIPPIPHLWMRQTAVTETGIQSYAKKSPQCLIVHESTHRSVALGLQVDPKEHLGSAIHFRPNSTAMTDITFSDDGPYTMEALVQVDPSLGFNVPSIILLSTRGIGRQVLLSFHDDYSPFMESFGGSNPYMRAKSERMNDRLMVGQVNHIAAVVAKNKVLADEYRLFVNGKRIATNTGFKNSMKSVDLYIGGSPWTASQPEERQFYGILDEVRISSIARYDADFIPAIRHRPDEHTVALYHFDEGDGNIARDSSGHGNDAKITNATWVPEQKLYK